MRTLLLVAGLCLCAAPAHAGQQYDDSTFDDIATLSAITTLMCRSQEGPPAVVETACQTKWVYIQAMRDGGYCFDDENWGWKKCK